MTVTSTIRLMVVTVRKDSNAWLHLNIPLDLSQRCLTERRTGSIHHCHPGVVDITHDSSVDISSCLYLILDSYIPFSWRNVVYTSFSLHKCSLTDLLILLFCTVRC